MRETWDSGDVKSKTEVRWIIDSRVGIGIWLNAVRVLVMKKEVVAKCNMKKQYGKKALVRVFEEGTFVFSKNP